MKPNRLAWTRQLPKAIGAPAKKRTPKRKVTAKERDVQAMAEEYCQLRGVRFFRLPDALNRWLMGFAPASIRVFCARYLAGLPDMLLFRKLSSGDNICRMLEIKREDGKVSQSQKKWHQGLDVRVPRGWDQVKKEIDEFVESA